MGSWKIIAMRAPAHLAHLALGEAQQVAALEEDLPRGDAPRRLDEPQDGEGGDALAAAGLADEAEGAARGRSKETSSTARSRPSSVANSVQRWRMESSASVT
jgi:hypothetical protein